MGTKNALRATGKKDKELKHKQLEKPAVPVGEKSCTTGTKEKENRKKKTETAGNGIKNERG